jgi:hypothetical protein
MFDGNKNRVSNVTGSRLKMDNYFIDLKTNFEHSKD